MAADPLQESQRIKETLVFRLTPYLRNMYKTGIWIVVIYNWVNKDLNAFICNNCIGNCILSYISYPIFSDKFVYFICDFLMAILKILKCLSLSCEVIITYHLWHCFWICWIFICQVVKTSTFFSSTRYKVSEEQL